MNSKIVPWSKPGAVGRVISTWRSSTRRHARPGGVTRGSASRSPPSASHRQGRQPDRPAYRRSAPRTLLDVVVTEQPGGLGDELLPHHAGDAGDCRKARSQAIGARPHVTLLAAPHQRKSAGHQQAVAGRDAGCPGGGDPRTTQGPRDASVESSMFGIANLGSALTIYRLT
jgi:hypothetical protein